MLLLECEQIRGKRRVDVDINQYQPVGLLSAPWLAWGWTQDCWNKNCAGAPTDGSPWGSERCSYRVVRGGAWDTYPGDSSCDALKSRQSKSISHRSVCRCSFTLASARMLLQ